MGTKGRTTPVTPVNLLLYVICPYGYLEKFMGRSGGEKVSDYPDVPRSTLVKGALDVPRIYKEEQTQGWVLY